MPEEEVLNFGKDWAIIREQEIYNMLQSKLWNSTMAYFRRIRRYFKTKRNWLLRRRQLPFVCGFAFMP